MWTKALRVDYLAGADIRKIKPKKNSNNKIEFFRSLNLYY